MSELRIVGAQEWRERAEAAEAERDALRGEVVALREAVTFYAQESNWFNPDHFSYDSCDFDGSMAHDGGEHARIALLATPRSAQLGALVEAALKRRAAKRTFLWSRGSTPDQITAWWRAWTDAENTEDAAADAVLAATPTPPATVGEA